MFVFSCDIWEGWRLSPKAMKKKPCRLPEWSRLEKFLAVGRAADELFDGAGSSLTSPTSPISLDSAAGTHACARLRAVGGRKHEAKLAVSLAA